VSGANDVTGGGRPPQNDYSRTAVRYPHPALRATLPTRGRDKEDGSQPVQFSNSQDRIGLARHCERSEAIHWRGKAEGWIASSLSLLAMTSNKNGFALSRRDAPELCTNTLDR
jgi:hypothetical protein